MATRIKATRREYFVDYARRDEGDDYEVLTVGFGHDVDTAFVWAKSLNDSLEYRPLMVRQVTVIDEPLRIF